jgi:hypothetical protein
MAGVVNHPPASREPVKARQVMRNTVKVELALLVCKKTGGVGETQ